jgi:hypothetical protein
LDRLEVTFGLDDAFGVSAVAIVAIDIIDSSAVAVPVCGTHHQFSNVMLDDGGGRSGGSVCFDAFLEHLLLNSHRQESKSRRQQE